MSNIHDNLPHNADGAPVYPGLVGYVVNGRRVECVRVVLMYWQGDSGDGPHRLTIRYEDGISKGDERAAKPGELFTSESSARDSIE